eukprot:398139-Pleurochrysis_carterae.AAC.3
MLYDLATWLEAVDIHNKKLANRQAERKAVAAKAADNDPEASFAVRRIKKLAPLPFRDTLIVHCRSVLNDTELARARARPPATPLWGSDKIRALARRAHHDGFARYRDVATPAGCTPSDYAKRDAYRRYDTGEPHPLDGEASYIVGYVESTTRWQMYRYDKDALQPENGRKARFDSAAATEQRDRWVAAALEALELEAKSERYADDLFPEPYPSDPAEEEPSGTFSDLSDASESAPEKPK